jgi:hypothetical protein
MVFRAVITSTLAFMQKRFQLKCANPRSKNHVYASEWRQLPVLGDDASLLFRRMGLLRIDADDLARDEPL